MVDKTEILYNQLIRNIIYQDKHILVINKPINLPVQGGNKVKYSIDKIITRLSLDPVERQHLRGRGERLGQRGRVDEGGRGLRGGEVVFGHEGNGNRGIDFDPTIFYRLTHRIDKDTSGALILAKSEKAARKITKMFQDKKIYKTYLALVVGVPENKVGVINKPIIKKKLPSGKEEMQIGRRDKNVKQALTKYKVIDQLGDKLCLLEVEPITGRKHQIRIHLASIGIPILGDGKYGGKRAFVGNLSNKIHLHSYKIFIENYFGKSLSIKAPISDHLRNTFDSLGIDI